MRMIILASCACATNEPTDGTDSAADADSDTDADTDLQGDTDADTDEEGDTDDTDTDTDVEDPCTPNTVFPADNGSADIVLEGPLAYTSAGAAVAVVDLDGDGTDDVLVGAPEDDSAAAGAGRAWLAYGPLTAGGDLDAVAQSWFDGEDSGDGAGRQIGLLGDLDGDGFGDVAVSAPDCCGDDQHGKTYIAFGGPVRPLGGTSLSSWDAALEGSAVDAALAHGMTGMGDLDGDGFGDAALADAGYGANDEGRVYFLPGSATRPVGDIDEGTLPWIEGVQDDTLCSGRCLVADDFDGDGTVDLAMATDAATTGRLYLRYGDGQWPAAELAADLPVIELSEAGLFGNATAAVGDLDGDGYPDLAIGQPSSDEVVPNGGRTWVVRGTAARWSGTTSLYTATWLQIVGVSAAAAVGSSVVGLGDIDCDGFDDLAVGAAYANGLQPQTGAVAIWLGPTGGFQDLSDATATILGGIGLEGFGSALAHGDVNGNGEADLVVGAPDYGLGAGRVYLFLDAF
jgi:hypothetical protein